MQSQCNCDCQGLAKYGMKSILTLLKSRQQDVNSKPSSPNLVESAWQTGYARTVDGIDTFGEKQQTIKLLAMQVSAGAT